MNPKKRIISILLPSLADPIEAWWQRRKQRRAKEARDRHLIREYSEAYDRQLKKRGFGAPNAPLPTPEQIAEMKAEAQQGVVGMWWVRTQEDVLGELRALDGNEPAAAWTWATVAEEQKRKGGA